MLQEIRAEAFTYHAETDTARIHAPGAAGPGRLGLIDGKGFLVGLDLRSEDGSGTVVILGPHEAVEQTRELDVRVEGDDVVIAHAGKTIRGAEKNPYA